MSMCNKVCVSFSCVNLHNQQHVLVMCAVAFYMMENYPLDVGSEFNAGVIQVREDRGRYTVISLILDLIDFLTLDVTTISAVLCDAFG